MIGAFGNVNLQLIWHVECEFKVFRSLTPNIPPGDGDAVVLWQDLIDSRDLTPFQVGAGQVSRYQFNATNTGRPDIQSGKDWRVIFQGNFNFIGPNSQLTYGFFGRVMETTMAFMSDGNPNMDGLAFGFGCNGSLDDTSGVNQSLVGSPGVFSYQDSGIGPSPNCGLIVTYDGLNGGLTKYYKLTINGGGNGGQVISGTSFSQQVNVATGGFALGGTFNNSDTSRFANSLSNLEAAVWNGIMTDAMRQQIADNIFTYWGYT